MARIDIPLDPAISEALNPPEPRVLKIPFLDEPQQIRLPGGATLPCVTNIPEKIPDDCARAFSLNLMLQPFLGNFKCLFDILSLLAPLIEIIGVLTKGKLPSLSVLEDFGKAAAAVTECVAQFTTPAGLALFIIDILDLILKILNCVIDALKSALSVLEGVGLDLIKAQDTGNLELIAALECAQQNAMSSAQASLTAIEPLSLILGLISPIMEIVGADPIEIPTLGHPESAEALGEVVEVLEKVVDTITTIRNAIPVP